MKAFNPKLNGTPLAAAPASWTHIDHRHNAAYIHLHDAGNRILRLSGQAELVENGSAPELAPTTSIQPIDFEPTVQARTGLLDLKALVTDFLPIHPNQRWIVTSWLLTAFFLNLVRQRALLQITGESGSGKSTLAGMLSCLLYGCSVDSGAAQAHASLEAGNPLLTVDSPGDGNGSLDSLLLGLAQGTARRQALALLTGSDGFESEQLRQWTYQVECRRKFHESHFMGSRHCEQVIVFRRRILSGIFQLLARDVVPGLEHRRAEVLQKIGRHHPVHPKSHLDSFLALMTVILQALLGNLHGSGSRGEYEAWRLISGWIEEQE